MVYFESSVKGKIPLCICEESQLLPVAASPVPAELSASGKEERHAQAQTAGSVTTVTPKD